MSLKDKWKEAGKDLGHTFADLSKAVVKSVKEGVDNAAEDETEREKAEPSQKSLKQTWSKVRHDFGKTGVSLGSAAAGTAKLVIDKIDSAANDDPEDGSEKKDEGKKD